MAALGLPRQPLRGGVRLHAAVAVAARDAELELRAALHLKGGWRACGGGVERGGKKGGNEAREGRRKKCARYRQGCLDGHSMNEVSRGVGCRQEDDTPHRESELQTMWVVARLQYRLAYLNTSI